MPLTLNSWTAHIDSFRVNRRKGAEVDMSSITESTVNVYFQ